MAKWQSQGNHGRRLNRDAAATQTIGRRLWAEILSRYFIFTNLQALAPAQTLLETSLS